MRKLLLHLIAAMMYLALPFMLNAQPKEEVRAVWLTRIYNIDWPKTTAIEIHKQDLIDILDDLHDANFNTIMFQVRSRGDLAYYSEIEPYGKEFTGTLGGDPGYDVLEFLIDEAHKRGMEVHGWFVTYPVHNGKTKPSHPDHVTNKHPEYCVLHQEGSSYKWWLNPGLPEVREYLRSIVREMVSNYDIDGIHYDYIRYPGSNFDDDAAYELYGNDMKKSDWRRQNINQFVYESYDDIQEINPRVKLGSAPVGVYKNTTSFTGWQRYSAVYQDSRDWLEKGKHDYVCPQIYWDIGSNPRFHLVANDEVQNSFGRHVYTGMASYRLAPSKKRSQSGYFADESAFYYKAGLGKRYNWPAQEILNQIDTSRAKGALGQCYFSCQQFTVDYKKIRTLVKENKYQYPANIPSMPWKDNIKPNAPENVKLNKESDVKFTISWDKPAPASDGDEIKYYNVYMSSTPEIDYSDVKNIIKFYVKENSVVVELDAIPESDMYFAVTAYDPGYNESEPSEMISSDDGKIRIAQIAPVNNTTGLTINPKIEWESDASANYYIQISEDAGFSSIDFELQSSENYIYSADLQYEKKYYWRVKSDNTPTWSYSWGFTTKSPFLKEIWTKCRFDNTQDTWQSLESNNDRAIAVNENGMYAIGNNEGAKLYKIDKSNGDKLADLSTEGIDVVLSDIESDSNNTLIACNLTDDASSTEFKIYKWTNDDATPELVIDYKSSESLKIGASLTVKGDISANATIYAPVSNSNKIAVWEVTDGTVGEVSLITIKNITSVGEGASIAVLMDGSLVVNGTEITPTLIDSEGNILGAINESVVSKLSTDVIAFNDHGFEYLAIYEFVKENETTYGQHINMLNVKENFATITSVDIYDMTFTLGIYENTIGGNVEYLATDNGSMIYGLAVNNGIGAYQIIQTPPFASDVAVTGSVEAGYVATGTYNFSDENNDAEGESVYQWYRANNAQGDNPVAIEGANEISYTSQIEDVGKFIFFEVKPVAVSGLINGITVKSDAHEVLPTSASPPVASNISISMYKETRLIASYDYYDENGDKEGDSQYKWYIADNAQGTNKQMIEGDYGTSHLIDETDYGKYFWFEVTPVAKTGVLDTKAGETIISEPYGPLAHTGIENDFFDAVIMYPNPVNKALTIKNIMAIDQISIIDILGKEVKTQLVNNKAQVTINLSDLQNGVYLVRLITGNGANVCKKIIKK